MGIYQRDNINYQSMIDNMIKNRMHTAERDAERIVKKADIKAQTAKDIASTFARGMDYAQYASEASELENKLKDLEERRDYIRSQYDYNADYKPYSSTEEFKASEQMKGYKPNDYDVDQLAERVKKQIYDDSIYRNVNTINLMR